MLKFHFVFILLLLLNSSLLFGQQEQASAAESLQKINRPFIDISAGGMWLPNQGVAFNLHGSIGYQINSFLGIGIGTTASTNFNDLSHKFFQGFGLEYRLHYKKLIGSYMLGLINRHKYPFDSIENFEYIRQNDLFHRVALGYKPSNSHFNFGLVLNASKGEFEATYCGDADPSICQETAIVSSVIVSPQIYFGINIFK